MSGKYWHYGCGPLFYLSKHICPACKTVMEKKERRKTINSESEEAKEYGYFWVGDMRLKGDIQVIENYYLCPCCGESLEPKALQQLEREQKKASRRGRLRHISPQKCSNPPD
ncbi:MAG: hypothetical protein IJ448_06110 [Oscillospiraceae bacterium]|nr:hypothetical protein [Oscillospiraceae bacterium]